MVGLSRIMLKIVVLVIGVGDRDKHKPECIAMPFAMKYKTWGMFLCQKVTNWGRNRGKLRWISKICQNRSLRSPYYSELESNPLKTKK